ncbi:hypothetical protein N658DRAFT_492492 [Parathielavia hyrcaniae]|uniref:Uncharacterized protein n=1 Tax=Parathielavia hyrcaniae TaxID=113614 RepID=A0AAN6T4E5_9PEZI|nr:hypothetical protein N658DRAFT_492492 [Parathielavia hyrcaniae]
MSLTNPPSTATGPGSVSAVRTQTLKRSVQAAFEGMDSLPVVSLPVRSSVALLSTPVPFPRFRFLQRGCGYPKSPRFLKFLLG